MCTSLNSSLVSCKQCALCWQDRLKKTSQGMTTEEYVAVIKKLKTCFFQDSDTGEEAAKKGNSNQQLALLPSDLQKEIGKMNEYAAFFRSISRAKAHS